MLSQNLGLYSFLIKKHLIRNNGGKTAIEAKGLAFHIAQIAKSKKGEKVYVLDLRNDFSFCDYFVIASGSSLRQINAIAQAIEEGLSEYKIKSLSKVPSNDQSGWIVLDFMSVVVHLFFKPMRDFYSLERLWSDAKRLRIPSKKPKMI